VSAGFAQRLAAETIGTAFLLAGVAGSGIMAETLTPDVGLALLANTIATGAILVVLITTLGPISGAHFNPAVTLAMALRKRIGWGEGGLFVLAQIVGGLVGVWAAHAMFAQEIVQFSEKVRTGPDQWFAEGVATFGLVFFIFLAVRYRPQAVAWTVGLYITAAYWFTASTSFANPAVTIARSMTDTFSGIQPVDAPGFIAAQLAAAVLAAVVAAWIAPGDDRAA
jgi:glycerol uptake facilitator-like aquaporin